MYYWQYVKNGLIDQDLRTVQTIIHNHSWYFCLFSGNEGDFWISATYDSRNDGWYWINRNSNYEFVSQSFWSSGQPDGSHTCPCMWRKTGSRARWDDQNCNENKNYVCEKKLY